MKKRILCVGADVVENDQLQRQLVAMSPDWGVMFAGTTAETLELAERIPFDAVVAELRLPETDGARLLNSIMERHPKARRVILSDPGDRDALIRCLGTAHHYLSKPWDAGQVSAVLERAFTLDLWLANEAVKRLVSRMQKLPSPPELYFQVVKALQSPEADIGKIGQLISRDLAMTAKLLQLANSAVLGLRRKVTNAEEAVMFLGLETTRSLILLAHTFSYFDSAKVAGFSMDQLWRHSLSVGGLARRVAEAEEMPSDVVEESFTAGVLHDIGKLLMVTNLAEDYALVLKHARERKVSLWEAELELMGATHAEVGADLLATWNLPLAMVEALALHHYPAKLMSRQFCPLTAVHAANAIDHELHGKPESVDFCVMDGDYLDDLGLSARREVWLRVCREAEASEASNADS